MQPQGQQMPDTQMMQGQANQPSVNGLGTIQNNIQTLGVSGANSTNQADTTTETRNIQNYIPTNSPVGTPAPQIINARPGEETTDTHTPVVSNPSEIVNVIPDTIPGKEMIRNDAALEHYRTLTVAELLADRKAIDQALREKGTNITESTSSPM